HDQAHSGRCHAEDEELRIAKIFLYWPQCHKEIRGVCEAYVIPGQRGSEDALPTHTYTGNKYFVESVMCVMSVAPDAAPMPTLIWRPPAVAEAFVFPDLSVEMGFPTKKFKRGPRRLYSNEVLPPERFPLRSEKKEEAISRVMCTESPLPNSEKTVATCALALRNHHSSERPGAYSR
ncbi:hypothetical protein TNCV_3023121, partial [Trichonephila clavipes]